MRVHDVIKVTCTAWQASIAVGDRDEAAAVATAEHPFGRYSKVGTYKEAENVLVCFCFVFFQETV